MNITFISAKKHIETNTIVVILNNAFVSSNYAHFGLDKYLQNEEFFKGKFLESKVVTSLNSEGKIENIILIGSGNDEELKSFKFEQLGGKIYDELSKLKCTNAAIVIDQHHVTFPNDEIAAYIANGVTLRKYKFNKYFTSDEVKEAKEIEGLFFVLDEYETAQAKLDNLKAVSAGVDLAKELVNEPPNVLFPESYAQRIIEELSGLKVEVAVVGEKEMRNLGMNTLLAVGQGSARESQMVIMEYYGDKDNSKPVAFVGKGVTFDTGGISLKPGLNMEAMKYDMAGSAAVVGAIKGLAARNAKVNAVGVVGLVENMPGGAAQRPSDIVVSMSGQTVEVLNTDAEGRLILADLLTYTESQYKPAFMVNLATLTGAIVIALGDVYGGLFSNDDKLAEHLIHSGIKCDEKLWRMPLHSEYDKMIKSDFADMQNISTGRGAQSITAAQFLQRFVKETPWAHLDIAGVASKSKGDNIHAKGATGFGVRLLNQLIQDYYEK